MKIPMNLKELGYNEDIEKYRKDRGLDLFKVGRIIAEHKERYIVQTEKRDYLSEITGNLRFTASNRSDFPAVGDWVAVSLFDDELAVIHEIFPRKTLIERKATGKPGEIQIIAANVDVAFIIQAVDRDFNINRIERYLTLCYSAGVVPVIILSKTDLIDEKQIDTLQKDMRSRISNVEIFLVSNLTNEGIDDVKTLLTKGKTYCFLGSSGAGKSTLINHIAGKELMKINEISTSTGRGKHTTSHRELILLESGGIIIDNPGMREVGISDTTDGLETTFNSITGIAVECKFSDCSHTHENGCAVLKAIEDNVIDKATYANYLKMEKEKQHFQSTLVEKRKKDREFGRMCKNVMKIKKQGKS